MSPKQRELARHALGLDNPDAKGRSYRNRYVSYTGHPEWDAMVKSGEACLEVNTYYLRREGAEAALNPGESLDPEDFPAKHFALSRISDVQIKGAE